MQERVIIMGAAGRDFHNFNVYFRNNPRYRVMAFTAAQIPDIEGRRYPPELAGARYPDGIRIHPKAICPCSSGDTRSTWWHFPTATSPTNT